MTQTSSCKIWYCTQYPLHRYHPLATTSPRMLEPYRHVGPPGFNNSQWHHLVVHYCKECTVPQTTTFMEMSPSLRGASLLIRTQAHPFAVLWPMNSWGGIPLCSWRGKNLLVSQGRDHSGHVTMLLAAISNTLLGRVAAICGSYKSSLGRWIGVIDHKMAMLKCTCMATLRS